MSIVTSLINIDVPGIGRLPVKDGASINFGGKSREGVVGDGGFLGHTETENIASIKCTLADTTALDKKKLQDLAGETITGTTNNGQQLVLTEAFLGNVLELSTKEGDLPVEFYGAELIQQA